MRRPGLPNAVRILAVIFIVLILVQGIPLLAMLNAPATPRLAPNGQYVAPVVKSGFASWNMIQPILAVLAVLLLGRIWFLLEKIADRLERNNRVDVALTLKKDY